MAQTTDEIVTHIESERARLQNTVEELQARVQDAADIRKQFRRHPMLLPATVIGTSLLLALSFRKH